MKGDEDVWKGTKIYERGRRCMEDCLACILEWEQIGTVHRHTGTDMIGLHNQCGLVSSVADPWDFGTDPGPEIRGTIPLTKGSGFGSGCGTCSFPSDLFVYYRYFLKIHLHHFSKKRSLRSHKTVGIHDFLLFLLDDPELDLYLWLTDPDAVRGGPKTWMRIQKLVVKVDYRYALEAGRTRDPNYLSLNVHIRLKMAGRELILRRRACRWSRWASQWGRGTPGPGPSPAHTHVKVHNQKYTDNVPNIIQNQYSKSITITSQ
jgi:hypothetical protein